MFRFSRTCQCSCRCFGLVPLMRHGLLLGVWPPCHILGSPCRLSLRRSAVAGDCASCCQNHPSLLDPFSARVPCHFGHRGRTLRGLRQSLLRCRASLPSPGLVPRYSSDSPVLHRVLSRSLLGYNRLALCTLSVLLAAVSPSNSLLWARQSDFAPSQAKNGCYCC